MLRYYLCLKILFLKEATWFQQAMLRLVAPDFLTKVHQVQIQGLSLILIVNPLI